MSRNFVRFDPAFLRACRIRSYAASNEPFIQIDRRANFFLSFHFSCPAHICPFCKFSPARLPVPPNPDKPEPKLCQNAQVFAVKRIINADSMKLSENGRPRKIFRGASGLTDICRARPAAWLIARGNKQASSCTWKRLAVANLSCRWKICQPNVRPPRTFLSLRPP